MKPTVATTSSTRTESPRQRNGLRGGIWRKFIPWSIGAVILFALVSALRPRPIPVETAVVATGPLQVTVLEEGKTRIRHRYVISPAVSGSLSRVELRAGAPIEANKTVLAIIEPQPASFLDPRSRAEAEARLKGTEASRMQRQTNVERAHASLELAEKEMSRAKELKRSGAIATKEWDTAESQVNILTRELHAAEFALQVAEFEKSQAEAVLMQTESPAGIKTKPIEIKSPVSGYVLNVYEESSRIIPAGTPVMEVGDPSDLEAEIELLSSDAVGVAGGAEVSIEQWGGDQPLRGRVAVVEPGGFTKISALGVEEQRVKVRVDFVDPVPPGKTLGDRYRVEARIMVWRTDNVLQVPTGALFRRGGDWVTFAISGGKAKLTKVQIGHNNGVAAELLGGLNAGESVVVHAPDAVSDGKSVAKRDES